MKNIPVIASTAKQSLHIVLLIVLLLTIFNTPLAAQEGTQSATPSSKTQDEKIQDLKERLATKVAELRENQKGVIGGISKNKKDTSFTLATKKEEFTVSYSSEDTSVEQLTLGKRQEKKTTDLTNDQFVNVFGLVDGEKKTIDAKYILIKAHRISLVGTVTEVDTSQAMIKVKTNQTELFTVDYEKDTKAFVWTEGKLEKSGLSKIIEGDRIHIVGSVVPRTEKQIVALRIVHIPPGEFPDRPKETEAPSSTPSGTPKAALKPTAKPTLKPTPTSEGNYEN